MKILIVSHGVPTSDDPQWGCFELDQARALKALGHNVIITAMDGRYRKGKRKRGIFHKKEEGIDSYVVYWIPMAVLHLDFVKRWIRQKMMMSSFKHIMGIHGTPDIIYAHYMFGMRDLQMVKKKYPNIPIVGIEHWSKLNQTRLSKRLKTDGIIAYSIVNRLLAVSESLKEQIKKHFNRNAEVVYDMLGEEFVGANVEKKHAGTTFHFISVGSLTPIKGFGLLVEAFSKSGLSGKGCTLTIIGDGGERGNLQKQIDACGLVDSVVLTGRMNKEQIVERLKQSDAFVLASSAETFGVVYIEAMSQGLPVIATKCGGPEEFVNDSNGILIPTEDVQSLKKALLQMYDGYEHYDNIAIAAECNRRFAPHNIARQLEKIFEEEIEKKK